MSLTCPTCSETSPAEALVCAACSTLLWRDRLAECYAASRTAEAEGNLEKALSALADCCLLLPAGTRQFDAIQAEIQRLSHLYSSQPPEINQESLVSPEIDGIRNAGGRGFIVGAFRSTARGLTRPTTVISLAVWTVSLSFLIGWKSALVFGLYIYVHEIGHLLAIQYYGYRFAWPVFVPFLGAFVLQGKQSEDRRQNIIIAAAGPFAGSLASAAVFLVLSFVPNPPQWLIEVSRLNLIINLINLLPIWLLDGARIARQLTRRQLFITAGALSGFAAATLNGFALLMAAGWWVGAVSLWNNASQNRSSGGGRTTWPVAGVVAMLLILVYCCNFFRRG